MPGFAHSLKKINFGSGHFWSQSLKLILIWGGIFLAISLPSSFWCTSWFMISLLILIKRSLRLELPHILFRITGECLSTLFSCRLPPPGHNFFATTLDTELSGSFWCSPLTSVVLEPLPLEQAGVMVIKAPVFQATSWIETASYGWEMSGERELPNSWPHLSGI